jgi:hypothetical protein
MTLPLQSSPFYPQQQQQPIAFRIGTLQPVDFEKDKKAAALLPPPTAAVGAEEAGEESEEDSEEDSDEEGSEEDSDDEQNWDTASMVSHSLSCMKLVVQQMCVRVHVLVYSYVEYLLSMEP